VVEMPVTLPSESESAVRDSIDREKKIVEAKLEKYRKKLNKYEEEHGMDSKEFIQKFKSGKLGDDEKWFEWKFAWEAHQRLMERKQQLEKAV